MKYLIKSFINDFIKEAKDIRKDGIKNHIPNILTFSRALSPIIIIPTIFLGRLDIAIIELIFFEITDFLDGKIARKYDCVSQFGVKLDAVADKIFALGIMIPAIIKVPILFINLLLEILISYINLLSATKNNNPKSSLIGKIKTTPLSITLVLAYISNNLHRYVLISSIITALFQIWALIKYHQYDMLKDKNKKKK